MTTADRTGTARSAEEVRGVSHCPQTDENGVHIAWWNEYWDGYSHTCAFCGKVVAMTATSAQRGSEEVRGE